MSSASVTAAARSMSKVASGAIYSKTLKVGDLQLSNRVLFSPCTRNRGNVPGDKQAKYYAQRASAGLIVSEGTLPVPQGYEYQNAPGIYSDAQVAGWRKVTDAVHAAGGKIFNQVMNIGRVANPIWQSALPPMGPSAVRATIGGRFRMQPTPWVRPTGEIEQVHGPYVKPEAIPDPKAVLAEYRHAFENSKKAGFDGVELHGGNGYLLAQFLDATSNVRTDEYGGSPEKRCRFVLEVMDIAIEIFGAGRVGIKVTPEGGFNDMGMPLEELKATFGHLFRECEKRKIAYIQVQRWFPGFDPTHRGTIVPITEWRKMYKGTLFLNGELSPEEGASLIESGACDAILFGRFFIANPDLPERLFHNHPLSSGDPKTWYVPGDKGYVDYKRYDELSDSERAILAAEYKAAIQTMLADHHKTQKEYVKQENEAGRTPQTVLSAL